MANYWTFTAEATGIQRVLTTPVIVSTAFDPNIKPHPPGHQFNAIWDTGATGTVISENVVKTCGLQPTGMANVSTAGGNRQVCTYLVNVMLPNKRGFAGLKVCEGKIGGADLLIGMDIIGQGDFAVTNFGGNTVFTYRNPSTETIDFAKNPKPMGKAQPKVGRNQRCPCGSGKKYKRCCGA